MDGKFDWWPFGQQQILFFIVSFTCTDRQLTNEVSIVSTSQRQLPLGQDVTVPTCIAHNGPSGNRHLPQWDDQLYVIRLWIYITPRRWKRNMYSRRVQNTV